MGRAPHVTLAESAHDHAIVQAAMTLCDVQQFATRRYLSLSGGEQQRVQLARVLAQIWEATSDGARTLLLDEPVSNSDLHHQHSVFQTVRAIAAQGVAVLVVVHALNLAAQYAHRIAVLHRGALVGQGAPAQIISPSMLADVFNLDDATVMPHPSLGFPLVV